MTACGNPEAGISIPLRCAAALIAVVAWIGLALQFQVTFAQTGSSAATLWILLGYFTIITNVVTAVVFSGLALGRAQLNAPRLIAGVMLAVLLVAIVYALLLRKKLDGDAAFADQIEHIGVPILVPLFWIIFVGKGAIRRHDPILWALYPLCYFAYAIVRGSIFGHYPYPFIDVARIGWPQTLTNAAMIAAGFLAFGYAILALDHHLKRFVEHR